MYRKVGEYKKMTEFQYLDKRVQRSKQDLSNALFTLLERKKYDQIFIKDIIEEAGYSRGTFYAQYTQKDDLLFERIRFLFNEMIKAYRSPYENKEYIIIKDSDPLNLLNHFMKYSKDYHVLLGSNVNIDFKQIITNLFIALSTEEFEYIPPLGVSSPDNNILINQSLAYGAIGIILEWIKNDFPITPKQLSDELTNMFQLQIGSFCIKRRHSFNEYITKSLCKYT